MIFVIIIKSCKPGIRITTSEETTPNQFVYPDTLNTCLDELDRGSYFNFPFILVASLILRDNDKDTPAVFVMESDFE